MLNEQYSGFYSRLIATITENISNNIIRGLQELTQLNWDSHIDTIPKKELALYAGCSVEYVFRTLSKLEKKGAISTKGGRITIKNTGMLEEHID